MPAFDFDPFDAAHFEDPYPAYKRMRNEFPAYKRLNAEPRVWPHYWMLSRASHVDAALKDWKTFSSAQGTLVDTDISLIPPNIFNMDPPRHDELRSILARALTPARVEGLEERVRACAEGLFDDFAAAGRCDAATQYAHLIPTLTMCELMDLPKSEQQKFLAWNFATLAGNDFTSEAALAAYAEMGAYWVGLVAERRAQPGDDLISQILHTPVRGAALGDDEIAGFCSLLHDASQNTTMNTIAHALLALGRHPDERRKLEREPARWPRALEEMLRYVSPVQGLTRNTTRDVDIDGTIIPAGDQVLLLYGSANHDERVYDAPDTLDLDRDVRSHFAFGGGIHHCLGNAVARLEVRVALQVFVDRCGPQGWAIDEPGVELNQLVPTRGVAHAPVEFAAR